MKRLEISGVSKSYGRAPNRVEALRNVTLDVNAGEVVSILGLNGAGKTTLVKILAGLIDPDSGTIRLDGSDDRTGRSYRKTIGAVFEGNRNIYWRLTAFENLEYFSVLRGLSLRQARQRSDEMLELFRLKDKRKTIAAHLSRGMQQRLSVAISMVHRPELLVLDEPTLGVDIENMMQLVESLRALAASGIAIVVTSHQYDVVKLMADRIALLVAGKLAAMETKAQFLASTARNAYQLQLASALDAQRAAQLALLGVEVADTTLRFPVETLYPVLDLLRPLSIASLSCGEDDLGKIFLERVRDFEHA
jgi:ABC-2 type transport system ATP-binding protein